VHYPLHDFVGSKGQSIFLCLIGHLYPFGQYPRESIKCENLHLFLLHEPIWW